MAHTVAWGWLRSGSCCLLVVRHGSQPAWQTMASLLAVVGPYTPHSLPQGGQSYQLIVKKPPLVSPRTPPRRPRHIPGVVRPTIDRAVRLPIAQSHRDIGLPEETGAGPEHTGRDRAVDRGSIGLEGQHPGTL